MICAANMISQKLRGKGLEKGRCTKAKGISSIQILILVKVGGWSKNSKVHPFMPPLFRNMIDILWDIGSKIFSDSVICNNL